MMRIYVNRLNVIYSMANFFAARILSVFEEVIMKDIKNFLLVLGLLFLLVQLITVFLVGTKGISAGF